MSSIDINPRAVPGDNANAIDYGAEEAARLARDYPWIDTEIDALTKERETLPPITSDETMGLWAKLEKRCRDLAKRLSKIHDAEKEPHLRRGQAVDKKFFGAEERLVKPKKTSPNGLADDVSDRINDWMQEKLRIERELREKAEREAREAEAKLARERAEREAEERRRREAEEAAQRERERIAREAEQKAARARNEENRKAAEETARKQRLENERRQREEDDRRREQDERDRRAREVEQEAAAKSREATAAASAKAADLVGTRVGDDIKVTMQRTYYADVVDVNLLDMTELWPFVTDKAKASALTEWAKKTGHSKQMAGARIGFTEKSKTK